MATADLHVHSKYSDRPSEWFLQRIGAALSYTEPEQVYDLAKQRAMSYVTITDHNTIEGSLEIAEKYEDAFTGCEYTTYFPEDGCKIHLLAWNINGQQHDDIQKIRTDIYNLRDYLVEQKIAHSVAHTLYSINKKLTRNHLDKLILLFDIFEGTNGAMSQLVNNTWYSYLKTLTPEKMLQLQKTYGISPQSDDSWEKGFVGGSDDHAGILIGKTYTMAKATNIESFLNNIYKRKSVAEGRSNNFQSLTFTLYKIAHDYSRQQSGQIKMTPTGALINHIFEMIFVKKNKNTSLVDRFISLGLKADNKKQYRLRLAEMIDEVRDQDSFDVEKNLNILFDKMASIVDDYLTSLFTSIKADSDSMDVFSMMKSISASLPGMFLAVPFFTSIRSLANNRKMIDSIRSELPVKKNRRILWFTDTINDLNGPSMTLKNLGWQFYSHGIDVKIVSSLTQEQLTDDLPPNYVNLPSIFDFDLPYYESYHMKVPSLLRALEELYPWEPDEVLISTPAGVGLTGLAMARLLNIPATGIYHTDFSMESMEITNDESLVDSIEGYINWFYNAMDYIKVPTREYIDILTKRGLPREKMSVFPRHIDHNTFKKINKSDVNEYKLDLQKGLTMTFIGRVSKDKNLPFMEEVYKDLADKKSNINFVVVGDGPYREPMMENLKLFERVVFTGKVPHEKLPEIFAQTDVLVFPSTTDTFGMAVLEAHSSSTPCIVSDVGGPKEIVQDGQTGYVAKALDKDDWVKKIEDMNKLYCENNEAYKEMSQAARAHVKANYGWKAVLRGISSEELVPSDVAE